MKKEIRTGFVGSGFAARFHYDALMHVHSVKVEVVGVYSVVREEMEEFAQMRNMRAFDSLEELINNSDVIHVCTPPVTHEPIVIEALKRDKDVIVEKPFTGYFGDGSESFNGDTFSREDGMKVAVESIERMLEAEKKSKGRIMYAENWIYAPAIQKEREIIEKSKAQVLWIHGEQSHSGSHSLTYGQWKLSGGGSMIGKGCHPISAAIYFKHVEGRTRFGKPIHPKSVTARVHAITRMPNYDNKGFLKTHYKDTEDFAILHIEFEDGTIADMFASELVLGGTNNWIQVCANNHQTKCNMSHNTAMQTYTPDGNFYNDVYIVEKIETKQGWTPVSPDEGWFLGYQHELEAFYKAIAVGSSVESNSQLAADVMATIYAGYLSAEQKGKEVEVIILK
ncbi:MAG: Gfo/Idh/MocA family oxidoreductase [Bacteroidales bacterium]|nr:Gfo/Idh/MocA family oxidoreductase [Bacteroidales bacterium]